MKTIQILQEPLAALLASLQETKSTSEQKSASNALLIASSLAGALAYHEPAMAERIIEVIGLSKEPSANNEVPA
ncbi:hypothetical protein E6Q11_00110 [Candidatus Dojkabacteria bacterium]|uniref:Uncharacterized protein n=1 Tax=Candidatus Dojkabacteria bacterium TaxID=2099670 RepID=A0A5C7JBR3_9BACT|nr:MAG: hypothetical protein E6Q11_00110 [Candidatus Dojkabacteria bacterium]